MTNKRHNYYNDFLKAYKALDERGGGDSFPEHGFRFYLASQMHSADGKPANKGLWQFCDKDGGIHHFTFENETTLHYKNSIIENRKPPLILLPVEDEKEIIDIVNEFKTTVSDNKDYKVYPENERTWTSPIPGVAIPKDKWPK